MGRYFGREPRYTREEIERQAQEEVEARISLGRPPAEDFAPIEARLAQLDREMAARAAAEALPPPPPMRRTQRPLSVAKVRLPAEAAPSVTPEAVSKPARRSPAKPRASRQPVPASEG